MLDEGVVAEAADVDTCLLLGAGFPFFLGGITKHLDQTGVSERVARAPLGRAAARACLSAALAVPTLEVCSASDRSPRGQRRALTFEGAARQARAARMHETTDHPTHDVGAQRRRAGRSAPRAPRPGPASRSSARTRIRAGVLARHRAPPGARRRARRDRGRQRRPRPRWKVRYGLMLGLERVLAERAAAPRLGHRAAPPPGRRARRDADRADRRRRSASRRERQRQRQRQRRASPRSSSTRRTTTTTTPAASRTSRRARGAAAAARTPARSRRYRFRHPTASGKTIAAAGFVEAARTLGVLILTHRRLLVSQFNARPDHRGLRRPLHRRDRCAGQKPHAREPDHDPDLRVVRAPRRRPRPRRVPARHLRRGAHRPRREDERRDPRVPGAASTSA